MGELKITMSDQSTNMLESFKKVVDTIIEEEMPFNDYVKIVIDKGIKAMIGDIIPKEPQVLWSTIERISEANPEFFCQFMVDILKWGEESNRRAAKEKLGFIKK